MHGSELRSAWPPMGFWGAAGQAASLNHCMASLSAGPGTDSSCAVNSCSTPPTPPTHTHLFFCLYVEVPPVQSLPISLPLPSFKAIPPLFATVLLTDHLDLSPRPHLAGSKGPFVFSADELWEVGLGWSLLPLTSKHKPGLSRSSLPLRSRGLCGAPDHPFLLYHLGCCHFY